MHPVTWAQEHLRACAQDVCLGTSVQMDGQTGARGKSHPLKRMAGLELEGPGYFWLAWKISSSHGEGPQICPMIIFVKPSVQWEELKQSRREAVGRVMLNGGLQESRKVTEATENGGGRWSRNSGLSYRAKRTPRELGTRALFVYS